MNAPLDFDRVDFASFMSVEAEMSVVGGLLLDNSAIDRIEMLKSEHFATDINRRLFNVIFEMISAGKNVDVVTMFEFLQRKGKLDEVGGMAYLNDLVTSVSSSALIGRYAEIIIDKHKLRVVRDANNEIGVAIAQDGLTGDEALNKAAEVLAKIEDADTAADSFNAYDVAAELLEDIGRRAEGLSADVIPTGFDCLDNDALDGGFERGNLVVIAGRTSMGKTAFAFNLLTNMTDTHVGLVISLEMSKLQLARRVAASLSKVSLKAMKIGVDRMSGDQWGDLTVGLERMGKKKFHIQERAAPTAHNICAAARKHKRKHGLDILVVDHLGLLDTGSGKENTAEKIGVATRALKNLALELNIVVLLLVQINRGGANGERPNKSQLRDSGRIEEDANEILLLHRDDYYRDEEDKKRDGHTHLICDKVRDGEPKTVHLKFDGQFSRFSDWDGFPPVYEQSKSSRGGRN